ncbi:MAG: hypothetical protein MJA27_13390 [Pseudanabaenales cyanobacterium]|nr:hypothetical protein [Pseudanabaenales cyanobacterium]
MCEPSDTLEARQRRSMEIFEEISAASGAIMGVVKFGDASADEIAQLAELDQRLQEAIALDPEKPGHWRFLEFSRNGLATSKEG